MLDWKTVLIVERDAYGALDLACAIEACEGRVAGPVATASDALAILDSARVAAAVIDGEMGDALAVVLRLAGNVPLIVQTSTPVPQAIAHLNGQVSVLVKPVDVRTVIDTLVARIGTAERPENQNMLAMELKQV